MDESAPILAKRLRRLDPEVRRRIIGKCCLYSASQMREVEPGLAELLAIVRSQGKLSLEEAARALSLAVDAGRRSFQLEEQDAPRSEWIKPFSEARILKSLAISFGAVPEEQDVAAVYELLHSQDHGSDLAMLLEAEISAASDDPKSNPEQC